MVIAENAGIGLEELLEKLPLPRAKEADHGPQFWARVISGFDEMIVLDEYYFRLGLATKAAWDKDPIDTTLYYNKVPAVLVDIFKEYQEQTRQLVHKNAEDNAGRLTWYQKLACLFGFRKEEDILEEQKEMAGLAKEFWDDQLAESRYDAAKLLARDFLSVFREAGRLKSFWYLINTKREPVINEYLERRPGDFKGCYREYLDLVARYHS
ncbi:TPA: hypothetical protein HA265_07585 [Candidatus Woesearchaeota archaeon]|nr:hypothetical protein [Candidatus Woesearchaeota archaeon]